MFLLAIKKIVIYLPKYPHRAGEIGNTSNLETGTSQVNRTSTLDLNRWRMGQCVVGGGDSVNLVWEVRTGKKCREATVVIGGGCSVHLWSHSCQALWKEPEISGFKSWLCHSQAKLD